MTKDKERCYMLVSGRVQGVGFRYYVSHQAAQFDLTGWVRNLDNGDVELEVQGSHAGIEGLVAAIREGNRWIRVDRIQKTWESPVEEREFRVRG